MVFEGVRNFKNQSYPPPPTFTEASVASASQNGRVVMVTGGNAGLGLGLCKILYGAGATVYMTSRSRVSFFRPRATLTSAAYAD